MNKDKLEQFISFLISEGMTDGKTKPDIYANVNIKKLWSWITSNFISKSDLKSVKELENWLKEDATITKIDRDYILSFIISNFISKDKVDGLKMKLEKIGDISDEKEILRIKVRNGTYCEINSKINKLIEK